MGWRKFSSLVETEMQTGAGWRSTPRQGVSIPLKRERLRTGLEVKGLTWMERKRERQERKGQ